MKVSCFKTFVKRKRSSPSLLTPSAAAPLEIELVTDWIGLVATAGLLAVTGATLGADGLETIVAFANTGRGAIGDAAIEDKKAEASDNAAEAAGGRTGATAVTPTAWAIAADASDKATEAC